MPGLQELHKDKSITGKGNIGGFCSLSPLYCLPFHQYSSIFLFLLSLYILYIDGVEGGNEGIQGKRDLPVFSIGLGTDELFYKTSL